MPTTRSVVLAALILFLHIIVYVFTQHHDSILLPTAYRLAHLESAVLHVPPNLRFFSEHDPDDIHGAKAATLIAIVLHSFITMPVMDYALERERREEGGGRLRMWMVWSSVAWTVSIAVSGSKSCILRDKLG